jgi:hypothetical protein
MTRRHDAHDGAHGRGFSHAVSAQESDKLSWGDFKLNIKKRLCIAIKTLDGVDP